MAAAIVTPNDRYPLWTRDFEHDVAFDIKSGKNIDNLKALSFLTEITVELCWADIPKITATLSPPYEDAIKFLDTNLVEWGTNRLAVQFGYASGVKTKGSFLSPAYEGMLLQPDISIGADSTIRLNAQGTGSFTASMTPRGKTYPNTTIDGIKQLLMNNNPNWIINALAVEKDPDTKRIWFDDKITYCQANKTDYLMMKELIFQARCTFVEVPSKVSEWFVYPRSYMLAKQTPDFWLTMFHLPSGSIGADVYPILSASSPPAALFLPGVQGLMIQDVDVKTKKNTVKTVKEKDVKTALTGPGVVVFGDDKVLPKPNEGEKSGFHAWPGDPAQPSFVQQAHSAFESASLQGKGMAFPLEIETIGVPSVLPGMICSIRGLGLRLDNSNYAVKKVVHTLNASGFSTRLSLINNAGDYIAKELSQKGFGPENKKAPDGKSDQTPKQAKSDQGTKRPTR